MSSSTPYASRQSHMDEYGFLFVIPRLGLPDPKGDWVTIKAAIGKKRDIVDLVVNPNKYNTPLRHVNLDETAFVPIEKDGALWYMFLVKPKSFSNTAPPEFFSIKLRRILPNSARIPGEKVPEKSDWLVFPFSAYEDQMTKVAANSNEPLARLRYGGGTVQMVKDWQEYERRERERGEDDISEEDALNGDLIDARWSFEMLRKAVSEKGQNDSSQVLSDEWGIFYRCHPAPGGDFRSVDYVVARNDEMETEEKRDSVAEDRWKPLPPEASKPGGERQFVNVHRRMVGKKPFSKEEWPPAPVRKQKRSTGGKKAKV